MTKEEFWGLTALNFLLFLLLNIWLLWAWALLISIVVVWGGFLIIDSSDGNIFD